VLFVFGLTLLIEIRTEPARREDPDRNERRGRILDVFDRGVRRRAGAAAATATGEFQSVVLSRARKDGSISITYEDDVSDSHPALVHRIEARTVDTV
jgi:hypothetical protein